MQKTLIVLTALAMCDAGSSALAGGGGGGGHSAGGHFNRGHFGHHFLRNQALRNQVLLGGLGWWGPYPGDGATTTVVAFPQATPQTAEVTGSIASGPCRWNEQTFTVPSALGGTKPITIVGCR